MLHQVWRVWVHPMLRHDVHAVMGQATKVSLRIKADASRRVRPYTTAPNEIKVRVGGECMACAQVGAVLLGVCRCVPGVVLRVPAWSTAITPHSRRVCQPCASHSIGLGQRIWYAARSTPWSSCTSHCQRGESTSTSI